MKRFPFRFDEVIACLALLLMVAIPLVEMVARPMLGRGFDNAPLFVQHMGIGDGHVGCGCRSAQWPFDEFG